MTYYMLNNKKGKYIESIGGQKSGLSGTSGTVDRVKKGLYDSEKPLKR